MSLFYKDKKIKDSSYLYGKEFKHLDLKEMNYHVVLMLKVKCSYKLYKELLDLKKDDKKQLKDVYNALNHNLLLLKEDCNINMKLKDGEYIV